MDALSRFVEWERLAGKSQHPFRKRGRLGKHIYEIDERYRNDIQTPLPGMHHSPSSTFLLFFP